MAFYVSNYPYPAELAASGLGRVLFGVIAGFFSGGIYRYVRFQVKKYLASKTDGTITNGDSLPPGTSEPPTVSADTKVTVPEVKPTDTP